MILKFFGLEGGGFLIDDMLGEIEHILRNFYILNVVEILVLGSDLIGVAEQGTHQSVLERL
jgi:hypothetical protein